jgi:hypothetical protein
MGYYRHMRIVPGIIFRLQTASAGERALVLGASAVISALLCNFIPTPAFLIIGNTPLLPAFWFGLVLCIGTALWASRRSFDLAIVMLSSFAAWYAAVETAAGLHLSIERQVKAALPSGASAPSLAYLDAGCGMVAGLVGSVIVVAVIWAVITAFRTSGAWARTILFGTVSGSLLEFINEGLTPALPIHIGSALPLYLVWQVSVAASIGHALAGKPDFRHRAPDLLK